MAASRELSPPRQSALAFYDDVSLPMRNAMHKNERVGRVGEAGEWRHAPRCSRCLPRVNPAIFYAQCTPSAHCGTRLAVPNVSGALHVLL
jgi:hypothetical protein